MSNRDTSSVQLLRTQFEVDKASLDASKRAFRELEGVGKQLVEAQKRATRVSDDLVRSLRAEEGARRDATHSTEGYQRVTKDMIRTAQAEAAAQDKVAQAYKNAARARVPGRGGGGGGGSADLGRIGLGVSSAAAVLPGGAGDAARGVADVIGVLDDVPRAAAEAKTALSGLGIGMGQLAVAGPLAIAAVVGIGLAVSHFTKQMQEAQSTLDDANQKQIEYYKLVRTASAEQLDAVIAEKELERDAYLDANKQIDEAVSRLDSFSKALVILSGVLGFGPAKTFAENKEAASAANAEAENLRRARNSQEVQDRSAAEAATQAAKETEKASKAAKESTAAEQRRTEAVREATQATNQLTDLYASIRDQSKQVASAVASAEEQRLKSLADLNRSYAEREIDEARQRQRDEAREVRRAAYERARAEIEGRDEAFELAADRDFAGLAKLGRQTKREAALKKLDDQFNTQEAGFASREAAEDKRIQYAREVANIEARIYEARLAAGKTDLEFARKAVEEYFRAKGLLGNIAMASDELIMRFYRTIAGIAGNPVGANIANAAPSGVGPVSAPGMAGRNVPSLPAGGGATLSSGGVYNQSSSSVTIAPGAIVVQGSSDPLKTALAIEVAIDRYFRGINR